MSYPIASVRSQFPALREGAAHFDGPGGTQVPTCVSEAVAGTLTAAIANRGLVTPAARRAEQVVTECRAALADLLGADPLGVVFGRSATDLAFMTARTLTRQWRPGDEIICSRLDHDSNIRPWLLAAEARGLVVRMADFDPDTADFGVEHVTALLSERTRLVAFTAASNLVGTRPDVAVLSAAAHAAGALVYLDAVHHVPHLRTDLSALGVDFLACSAYKFLGPHCGVLAADPDLLETMHPDKLLPSTDAVPERFELGTLPYELMAGTTAAVDFLAGLAPGGATERPARLDASFAALARHEDALAVQLNAGLAEVDGVRMIGSPARRTPTVLFEIAGLPSQQVAEALAREGVNAPAGSFYALEASRWLGLGDEGAVRAGLAPYSSELDVQRLVEAVAKTAAQR
ncbi:MAG: cysteine desulfurase-like protein [Actinomycetales bacterium]